MLALAALLAAPSAFAGTDSGGLVGWVEDTRGTPVAGAVISVYGKGLGNSGLVTLSDSAGRFMLDSLPAGSYTIRTLRSGHRPAAARQITVLPNTDATFTVSLSPLGEGVSGAAAAASTKAGSDNDRELRWLVRHKRRSVLEDVGHQTQAVSASVGHTPTTPRMPLLAGTVELVAVPTGPVTSDVDRMPSSLSVVRLNGRLAQLGSWSIGGLLAESGDTSWRVAGEFVLEPEGHSIQAGMGYGSSATRTLGDGGSANPADHGVGAVFVEDRWDVSDRFTATVGGRYSYIGFLGRTNHLDPAIAFEIRPEEGTVVRASARRRTVAPGGDLLTLSTGASPVITWASMQPGLEAERLTHYEIVLQQTNGPSLLRAHAFYEDIGNTLINVFAGEGGDRSLAIGNSGRMLVRGMGLTVGRSIGDVVTGSLTYTYGNRSRVQDDFAPLVAAQHLPAGDFHDVSGRVETWIDETGTRLVAYYRFNALNPVDSSPTVTSRRFDVQLSQEVPFIGTLTRADIDLLVGVRNMFYEAEDGALLDEVAVANPPNRVLGGISVRF